jgi:hypothetical protein
MKWAAIVLVSAVLVAPAAAHLRGIPPSVTSIGGSHSPGIPPSVTSIGNSLFNAPNFCCRTSLFPNQFQFRRGAGFRFHHGVPRGFAFPAVIAVPVAVPVPVVPVLYDSAEALQEVADPPQSQAAPRSRPPARVEDEEQGPEDNDRYGDHYLDSRERRRSASHDASTEESDSGEEHKSAKDRNSEHKKAVENPKPDPAEPPKPAAAQPATVLVFRDGHKSEVHDYAIVGSTLYDIGENTTKKIALADLDLDATTKANDDRGVSFQLPQKKRASSSR